MHPLQIIVVVPLAIYLVVVILVAIASLYLAFFGDTIKNKGNESRLIRWPLAVKKFLKKAGSISAEFCEFLDIITSTPKVRRTLREIQTGQGELPL
jgi:hypothetical protein